MTPGSWYEPLIASPILTENHYLGPTRRGVAWIDDIGIIVVANPTSRHLPTTWRELTRWCICSREKNAGSRQWGRFVRAFRERFPDCTTIVSYSDPGVGHDGALYRACNWLWAPTWLRLRPPPTANGSWKSGKAESVKDRWVFRLRPDAQRQKILQITDGAILRRSPLALYNDKTGVPFKARDALLCA